MSSALQPAFSRVCIEYASVNAPWLRRSLRAALFGALGLTLALAPPTTAQSPPFGRGQGGPGGMQPTGPLGVLKKTDGASPGYTLLAPFNVGETYLVDLDGSVVHQWKSEFPPGQAAELLPNGHLLRAARDPGESPMRGGGEGGRIEEFDWDGNLVWTYVCCDARQRQHHDFEVLPNGHVLIVAWEPRTMAEALEAGRDIEAAKEGLWPDMILEIEPTHPVGGTIVWEWHVWDHLIQDRDETLANFGVVADHPELLDINVGRAAPAAPAEGLTPEELEKMKKLGYIGADAGDDNGAGGPPRAGPEGGGFGPPAQGGPGGRRGRGFGPGMNADWNHINAVTYNAELDQIVLSSHNQNEIWIIDHGTTTEEATGHDGGRCGRGGDLLYRWGNPANWHQGDAQAQQLFGQHDARWIESGLRGAGHLLVFNNNMRGGRGFGFGPPGANGGGAGGPGGNAEAVSSQVFELELPLEKDGSYARSAGRGFAPQAPLWKYGGGEGEARFFSPIVSGSQRLPNGNTLITSGSEGYCVEITPKGEIAWEFRSPLGRDTPKPVAASGDAPPPPESDAKPEGGDAPPQRGRGRGGFGGAGGFGGMGGFMAGAIFRATRIAPDHPALAGRKLEAPAKK